MPKNRELTDSLDGLVSAPLTTLWIGGNKIGDEGAKFIAAALPQVR